MGITFALSTLFPNKCMAASRSHCPRTSNWSAATSAMPQTMAGALKGVDGVFHLAAEVGVGQSMYEIARYIGVNDLGTAVLLEQLIRNPVERLVVASSMSVYGEGNYTTPDGTPVRSVRRGIGRTDIRLGPGAARRHAA